VARDINSYGHSSCTVKDIPNEPALASAINESRPDVLVLSAHGHYSVRGNLARIMLGTGPSLLQQVENMPPLVVLSACHVAPRGTGAVTVADLLFRAGASAVVGTLVPVNVVRNGLLMGRFFSYLCEAISGRERYDTLDHLWHHVVTTHAIHDIYSMSRRVQEWAFRPRDGQTVDHEFKNLRSRGRLRSGHIYQDSEAVLMEIAKARGFDGVLGSTLASVGYLPESLFYVLLGRGDRFVLSRERSDLLSGRQHPTRAPAP
jgi:hypothetical protein